MSIKKQTKKPTSKKGKADLSNPVTQTANKIIAVLENMKNVAASFSYAEKKVSVYCSDVEKADALNNILMHDYEIGKLGLKVEVVEALATGSTVLPKPTYKITTKAKHAAYKIVFDDAVTNTVITTQDKTKWYFSEFEPIVLSWQEDNLQNPKGYNSCLLADLVNFAFDTRDIMVSTKV